jgi:adenylate cyclase
VQKFGVAFFWAAFFGLLFGGAAYFRVERAEFDEDPRWHVVLRGWLERVELATYDWRVQQLGSHSEPTDDVVLVTVDEETMANARESEHADWAMRPWPRELTGAVVEQVLREGARLVVLDESLADVSPRSGSGKLSDDEQLAQHLEKFAGKTVLTWDWSAHPPRMGDRPLTPFLLKVGEFSDEAALVTALSRVLTLRATAFYEPAAQVVWAGAVSEAKAKELAQALEVKSPTVRPLVPADDAHEVTGAWLAARLAQVRAAGFDTEKIPHARTIEAPVAPLLRVSAPGGPARMIPDPDGVVRGVPLFLLSTDENGTPSVLASAVLRAVMTLTQATEARVSGGRMEVGSVSVPVDDDTVMPLVFDAAEPGRNGRGTLKRSVPAWRLLINHEDDEVGRGIRHHDNELAGKVVVFIDERIDGGSRALRTPVGPLTRGAIIGQAIASFLQGRGITRVPQQVDFWLTVAFAGMGALLAMAWSSLVRRPGWLAWVVTIAVVALLHAFVARQLFVTQLRWVAMAAPLLACALTFFAALGYARALEQGFREFVFRALGGAVRADVFRRVEQDLLLMRPERRELAVFFSDVEGFTRATQTGDPRKAVGVLQAYLGEVTGLVLDSGGHVDKYLGDGLMAFWGAPVAMEDAALVACESALDQLVAFEKRREAWERELQGPLQMRVGLDVGPTIVGEMGTVHRVNYTVVGTPVANAFRLEALAKQYGVRALVTERVVQAAGEGLLFRPLDVLPLARDAAPQSVFELLGRRSERVEQLEAVAAWTAAVELFRAGRFDEARARFEPLASSDALAARYLARCQLFATQPPAADWAGGLGDTP